MKTDFTELLHSSGYKATPARLSILGLFQGECNPMNADEIYVKLKKIGIDRVTVYRTLAAFAKKGLIKQVHRSNDSLYYERNLDDHHHIICTQCDKISEFKGCHADTLIARALRQAKDFKTVSRHSFDLFGICNKCAAK